jgi:2-haloacid dehalogenase
VHIASGYPTDVEPCLKSKVAVIWVNRHGEDLEGRKKPDAEVKTFRDAGKLLKAA